MIHSFLLIGQSNMAGRGKISEAVPTDTSNIRILRNGRWQNMFRPINPDRSFSGVSLAESFAESYAKKHSVEVGLICCADGGTSIDLWQPDRALFDNAVYNAKLAQRTSAIAGILWHQGEADCAEHLYPHYKAKLLNVINEFRERLHLPTVPFIMGGLGDFLADCPIDKAFANYRYINAALEQIAAENENIGFVSAKGLQSNPDYLHFASAALYEFGKRYFEAFEKINTNQISDDDCPNSDAMRTAIELL